MRAFPSWGTPDWLLLKMTQGEGQHSRPWQCSAVWKCPSLLFPWAWGVLEAWMKCRKEIKDWQPHWCPCGCTSEGDEEAGLGSFPGARGWSCSCPPLLEQLLPCAETQGALLPISYLPVSLQHTTSKGVQEVVCRSSAVDDGDGCITLRMY